MKKIFLASALALLIACGKEDKDMEMPVISTENIDPVPAECDTYAPGDTIHFCYRFTDNIELGNYNIEIHNNFDHHTHSSSSVECPDGDEHEGPAVNPWIYNHSFSIPAKIREYIAHNEIVVPHDVDNGHYHFMIRLTDKAGWQQLFSVAINIENHDSETTQR